MAEIIRLPPALADQIAAGEVVERPASVVKELVENAVDAGATEIEITIQQGGQKLIQVADNGHGMNGDNIAMAFERHATSKVRTIEDLSGIKSLGFRGEALPSIGSVAQVWARSSEDGKEGYEITIEGGKDSEIRPAPGNRGTTVQVKNLFYNTPARRKFLKRPATENQHIIEVVRRFALCYPEITFKLTSGDRDIFNLPAADLRQRVGSVFDRFYQKSLKEVGLEKVPFTVVGYVGNLNLVRGRPGEQYIFLNRRAVQDRLLNSGVYAAYRSLISRGEYPFFVLNISMPIEMVDVNVHPAKTEVRFEDEWRVYHVVKTAVGEALRDIPGIMPEFTGSSELTGAEPYVSRRAQLPSLEPGFYESAPLPSGSPTSREHEDDSIESMSSKTVAFSESGSYLSQSDRPYNPELIWQVHNKYILSQIASGLVVIDQHVAHERVLFEEVRKALTGNALPSQTLLFPQTIEFAPDEYQLLIEIIPNLERLGFRIREFGKNTVLVEGVPGDLIWGREREVIRSILDKHREGGEGVDFLDHIAATYACNAAVKAGDPLTLEEMTTLVDRLFATENPYYCPHGRPIIVHLSLADLDHRFERI
ncbi:DNA mismatch repair endonuclease MutL [Candidatus Neomarinimicrobiota bacterium]